MISTEFVGLFFWASFLVLVYGLLHGSSTQSHKELIVALVCCLMEITSETAFISLVYLLCPWVEFERLVSYLVIVIE